MPSLILRRARGYHCGIISSLHCSFVAPATDVVDMPRFGACPFDAMILYFEVGAIFLRCATRVFHDR